jgi:replicative DNA helicase
MSRKDLAMRNLSQITDIDLDALSKQYLDASRISEVHKGIGVLEKQKIWVDETAGLTIQDARSKLGRLIEKHGIKIAYFDYIQLMSAGTGKRSSMNREQEVSQISRTLKQISKEFNIPVVALSQLSRETERRAGSKPQLSDLRESGSIEQDADVVMFLYRPEYYGILNSENGDSTTGLGMGIFAKNRHGSTGEVKMKYIAYKTQYASWEREKFFSEKYSPDYFIEPNKNFMDNHQAEGYSSHEPDPF